MSKPYKAFQIFTFGDVKFIAVQNGNGFHIADENGYNYGSWLEVERFRKYQKDGPMDMCEPLGKCELRVIHIEDRSHLRAPDLAS